MKAKLPIVGQVLTGEDAKANEELEKLVKDQVEKLTVSGSNTLGGVLNITQKLSNEKTISTKLLEANKGWVYRNNDVIAKEVGGIEFQLFRIDLKQGEIEYTEVDSHPLLDLLARFNESTTKSDAIYNTQSHKKLTGDAFWYLDGKGTNISNVFILQPDNVELDIGDPTDATDTLIDGYKFKQNIDGKQVEKYYTPDEIIHFKTPNPKNMFRGYGAVEAAAEDIDLDNLTTEVNRKFFEKGAITNFVLSAEGKINDEQLVRLKAELRAAYTGTKNAYNTMVLGNGLKPENISMSNKDMEFLAQLEWYRDKIMVVFGNTKASLGIIDDVNRASHESSIIAWKRNSVKPEMKAIVNTLNEFLVPRWGEKLVLGFKDPVPEDRESKLAEIEKAKSIMSVNERRVLLGYDEVDGGEIIPEMESNKRAEQMAQAFNSPVENAPKALKNVDLLTVLRRYKVFEHQKEYKAIRKDAQEIARKMINGKKAKPVITPEHTQFDNDTVMEYWAKQIRVVEVIEQRFKNALIQFIDRVEEKALSRVDEEVGKKKISKALIDEAREVVQAGVDFRPILIEQATISGQQALRLIKQDDPYIPFAVRAQIEGNIKKFASSMLDTEQEKMADILNAGVKAGKSVPQIRKEIQEAFDDLKKVQAERITRTEVLRVSNEAAVDAWKQSGVVEGKQWLTAEDDRVDEECAEYNGKIIDLDGIYTKTSYESVGEPPLHPNCRCVVLPILVDKRDLSFKPAPIDEKALMVNRIQELESQIDKRTKKFKELKAKAANDVVYIKALEHHLDVDDD